MGLLNPNQKQSQKICTVSAFSFDKKKGANKITLLNPKLQ